MKRGLYYLNSRYYNSSWGRFINADGYISTGTGLLGYNMFAYCNNNPVMYVDPSGECFFLISLLIKVAIISLVVSAIVGPSKEEHEIRNIFQDETVQSLGETETERIETIMKDWNEQDDGANRYHRFSFGEQGEEAIYNVKYMSQDKHMEVVICFPPEKAPYIVTDPVNEGTYNFGANLVSHYFQDMVPYYRWGNSSIDGGFERLMDRIVGR